MLLSGDPPLGCSLVNLLTMLIRAGQEVCWPTVQPVPPSDNIRGDRGVRMPQVRSVVHVVDGCRDVKIVGHGFSLLVAMAVE